jgi:hypothetical protein
MHCKTKNNKIKLKLPAFFFAAALLRLLRSEERKPNNFLSFIDSYSCPPQLLSDDKKIYTTEVGLTP